MNDNQRLYLIRELRKIFPSNDVFEAWDDAEDEALFVSVDGRRFAMEVGSDDDQYVFLAEDGKDPQFIRIPFERNNTYELTSSEIKSLPAVATEEEIEAIAKARGYILDGFTDQIDVRARNGRRIACYMAGG